MAAQVLFTALPIDFEIASRSTQPSPPHQRSSMFAFTELLELTAHQKQVHRMRPWVGGFRGETINSSVPFRSISIPLLYTCTPCTRPCLCTGSGVGLSLRWHIVLFFHGWKSRCKDIAPTTVLQGCCFSGGLHLAGAARTGGTLFCIIWGTAFSQALPSLARCCP